MDDGLRVPTGVDDRSQVSIGVVIMFVAMVAVAAIASGTLLGGANQLRQTAQTETEGAFEHISGGVLVTNEVGRVNASDGSVAYARLTVRLGAGMNRTNLSNATIQYEDDEVNRTLNWSAAGADATAFTTQAPIDHDGSAPILNSETDTLHLVIAVSEIREGADSGAIGLGSGDHAEVTITTERGIQTKAILSAPVALTEGKWVPL
ncbi:hypothetical protein [Haloarchaeobius sp. TZWWS8]|uniref:hypothetical protein n=1 Tax=Haloarchaeobius sp. TZWWS8 TaxID=3446121 RepID=UPI003EBB8D0B